MEMLPLYPIGNKETTGIGTSDYERAIEKAQKAIRQHSIKRRPIRKPGRAYTDEYKKWLARREFNPFIHRAWLLLGKSQYQKGDFPEAASTFSYIVRLYDGQTNITSEALIWLSRCYSALGWQYDAEDALNRVNNDSLPLSLAVPYASATGNYLLGSQRYKEAIPHLEKTAKNEKNKQQKARCYYLLGQTYQLLQQPEQAYQSYSKVIRLNPPYELALSARIRQTEVMPTANSRKITGKLLRLSKDEKNEEYLDQIYYALGNVYLAGKDTAQALSAYHKGIEKSTRNGVEKGILQLTLGNLYWQQARYAEAQKAYAEAIGLIDKTHREYADITTRSEILDELVPHTNTIQLQDSLQHLAGMPEAERMAVIENIIAQVIAREEAERKAAEEAERETNRLQMREEAESQLPATSIISKPGQGNTTTPQTTQPAIGGKQDWYFYNPQLVEQGKAEFQRLWGRRKLEDNWRRKNKTVVALDDFEEIDYSESEDIAPKDSIPNSQENEATESSVSPEKDPKKGTTDSIANDTHLPEDTDGIYLGGGYPETYRKELADNISMKQSICEAAQSGRPIIAECGGFMYVCNHLVETDDSLEEMLGLINTDVRMTKRLSMQFGYVTMKALYDTAFFKKDTKIRVHEFHYSKADKRGDACEITKYSGKCWNGLYVKDKIMAGYPHFYFHNCREVAKRFVDMAEEASTKRC